MLRALCLGWVTDSLKIISGLRGSGIETVVVNTDPVHFFDEVPALPVEIPIALNLYRDFKIPNPKFSRFFFTTNPHMHILGLPLCRKLASLLQMHRIDFVFANWGVGVLPEIALVKSIDPDIPVILNMETFPTASSSNIRESAEQRIFKKMAWALDGLIIPTEEMANLVLKLVPTLDKKPHWIKPFYFPKEFAPNKTLPKLRASNHGPSVVFMGQFDLRHSMNDVRNDILSLAEVGIAVYCAPIKDLEHPNVVFFEPFGGDALVSGLLTSYMTQFDACLVTYSTNTKPPIRFQTSLPSRFLVALIAGIPILLPKGNFSAMEKFLEEEGVGFAYHNPYDALRILTDSSFSQFETEVKRKSNDFVLNPEGLIRFVNKVIK